MARKKNKDPAKSCDDCIHENACQAWNVGTIHNTDATNCVNHETVKDSNAYFIGFLEGKRQSGDNTTLDKYKEYLEELLRMIPPDEFFGVTGQLECEYEQGFLGFINIYKPLSELIPKNMIIIDFGCYLAAQSYFFSEHEKYIGVDVVSMRRFKPKNAKHYISSIQDFVKNEVPKLFEKKGKMKYFAICSYVPDEEAVALVKETFPNVICYYPG